MLLNDKLRNLRKINSLTQEELAEKLNVSRQAITKWESGEGDPDVENLKQISLLFNVTVDELIKDDKDVKNGKINQIFTEELEIDHTKHFDIHIGKISELNLLNNKEEKVKVEISSAVADVKKDTLKVKFDNLYNRLDVDIKTDKSIEDYIINLYLPEKYIDEIELKSKIKTMNISGLDLKKFEYDGLLKYLNVADSKGRIILNTSKSDVEVTYDQFDGALEVNLINSVARVELPKSAEYKTVLKGIKNEFKNAVNTETSANSIELNGIGSQLIITEH